MTRATNVIQNLMWFWVIVLTVSLGQVIWWAFDRTPPFSVVDYTTTPSKAGGVVVIDANVRRDLDRDCFVEMSTRVFDSTGMRWGLGMTQPVTPDGIRELAAKAPGKLLRKIQLPHGMQPGPASIMSSMTYRCNPLHDIFRPITVETKFDFEVLP